VNVGTVFFRISQITAALMALGWIAVFYTAAFMRGGHPPLSAVVGIFVIFSSWILGTLGILCGLLGARQKPVSRLRVFFLAANAVLLGSSIAVNFV
jgi:hypothetical protein